MMISESFVPIDSALDKGKEFLNPIQLGPGIWRVSRGGKHFLLKAAKDNSAEALEMLKREYDIGAGLQHPHIISPIEWLEDSPAGPAILMEFWNGRTLDKFLAEKPSRQEKERVFEQLMAALSSLHRHSVIHNDIKPENILITEADNDVKLFDFGLSDGDSHYLGKGLGGTRNYSSPELLSHGSIDARSDIFSLGLILKDLFGKRCPYARIADKCSAISPDKRYGSIAELQKAWRRRHIPTRMLVAAVGLAILLLLGSYAARYVKESDQDNKQLLASADSLRTYSDSLQHRIDSLNIFVAQYKSEQDKENMRKSKMDELESRMQKEWERCFKKACREMDRSVYMEFCSEIMGSLFTDMTSFSEKLVAELEGDRQAEQEFRLIQTKCFNKYADLTGEKLLSMPTLENANLSDEELEFYIDLVQKGQAYRPYAPSHK